MLYSGGQGGIRSYDSSITDTVLFVTATSVAVCGNPASGMRMYALNLTQGEDNSESSVKLGTGNLMNFFTGSRSSVEITIHEFFPAILTFWLGLAELV